MSLIDDKEKFTSWIDKSHQNNDNSNCILCEPNINDEYWSECEQGIELEEYDFNTVRELKEIINRRVSLKNVDDEVVRILVASIFKSKPKASDINNSKQKESEINIPEFIYTF